MEIKGREGHSTTVLVGYIPCRNYTIAIPVTALLLPPCGKGRCMPKMLLPPRPCHFASNMEGRGKDDCGDPEF